MNINKNKLDSDNQDIEIVNLKLKEDLNTHKPQVSEN